MRTDEIRKICEETCVGGFEACQDCDRRTAGVRERNEEDAKQWKEAIESMLLNRGEADVGD